MKTIEEAVGYYIGEATQPITAFKQGVEFAQRWIPVEEELPEINTEVLTKTADEWYRIMTYPSVGNRFPSQVTHWRPIEYK